MRRETTLGSSLLCLLLAACRPAPAGCPEAEVTTEPTASVDSTTAEPPPDAYWKQPPQDVLDVLHAPSLPWVFTSPPGTTMLLADPLSYPDLADVGGTKHKLAGMKVDPRTNGYHGRTGALRPRLVTVEGGEPTPLGLPDDLEIHDVRWSADGKRFALVVEANDHTGVWVGGVDGSLRELEGVMLNPLMDSAVQWMPDQTRLLVRQVPRRGAPPQEPSIPAGPKILEGKGATAARSTYESRNLLQTAHDDALFDYFATCELAIVDPSDGQPNVLGKPAVYSSATPSPDGEYLLVERLVGPWSHAVPYWRFAEVVEVWDSTGAVVATVAKRPVAENVPTAGVRTGPRNISWRPTAPHTLFWVEALDQGDPLKKVPHRDRIMRLEAPFSAEASEVFRAEHRLAAWNLWTAEGDTMLIMQRERIRRWMYASLLDVTTGKATPWFDRNVADSYNSPGWPVFRRLPNGRSVMRQSGNAIYFSGTGATKDGARPFLDLRDMKSDTATRLYRARGDHYEAFVAFAGDEDHLIVRSESPTEVPNYHRATLGAPIDAPEGEAGRAVELTPITRFEDPTPQLRKIEKRIVRYKRKDGVPLSFQLYLPPGYKEGDRVPTVLHAYPLEYSDAATAGQVRGSTQRFSRLRGVSPLFFALQGYAVLFNTAMPMIGDPESTYDTFVEQLVADAEAAVDKAVEIGVADPKRIGVIGHSHGGLMVANLLAHTDLFAAGIARSGSYNKTVQPFGFQSERRTLFDARDVYIQVSPTFFANKVNEPILIVHGDADSNPGTLTAQSRVFYEAVRGSGGNARLVLLPEEDHGYRAKENIEHTLWEQLRWFDMYLRGATPN